MLKNVSWFPLYSFGTLEVFPDVRTLCPSKTTPEWTPNRHAFIHSLTVHQNVHGALLIRARALAALTQTSTTSGMDKLAVRLLFVQSDAQSSENKHATWVNRMNKY